MTAISRRPDSGPVLVVHADESSWIQAIVGDATAAIGLDLERKGHARALLSGGATPAPVYRALAQVELDWAKVKLALVDERWLSPENTASNGRLVRDNFLVGPAAAAHFEPMLVAGQTRDQAVQAANRSATEASVAFLGMGPDGHTASLFPRMRGLRSALESPDDYVSVDADDIACAAPWWQRISLTPAGLARVRLRLLLIRGEQKRALLVDALAGSDLLEFPVRAALFWPGASTRIHWCP